MLIKTKLSEFVIGLRKTAHVKVRNGDVMYDGSVGDIPEAMLGLEVVSPKLLPMGKDVAPIVLISVK